MSLTHKTDSSFFMYVKPPGSYIGVHDIQRWFYAKTMSKFRLIIDPELDENFATLKERSEFYPGIKSFAVVLNPWARMKLVYDDLQRVQSPISYLAEYDFETFISRLHELADVKDWPFSFSPLAPQAYWLEYTDDSGNKHGVDYIFHAEDLDEEFKVIQDYFGSNHPLVWTDHIPEYKEHYTELTKNIVAELFKEDIEKFGYKF